MKSLYKILNLRFLILTVLFFLSCKKTDFPPEPTNSSPCDYENRINQFFLGPGGINGNAEELGISQNPTLSWACFHDDSSILSDVYLDTFSKPTTKIVAASTSRSINVTGLKPNTTYYWYVYMWNPYLPCDKAESDVYHFTTRQEIKPPGLLTTAVSEYTSSTATIGGIITANGGSEITECGVFWGTATDPVTTGKRLNSGTVGSGSFSSIITGLDTNTTYYVVAYASNSIGTTYGSKVSFDLKSGSPRVMDIDGNIYNTIAIGNQVWMAENLKTTRYSDGTSINFINTTAEWNAISPTTKAYCWYDDSISKKDIYGAYYTWFAAMNGASSSDKKPSGIQGVCPAGWHLPSEREWAELETTLGG